MTYTESWSKTTLQSIFISTRYSRFRYSNTDILIFIPHSRSYTNNYLLSLYDITVHPKLLDFSCKAGQTALICTLFNSATQNIASAVLMLYDFLTVIGPIVSPRN